MSVPEGTTDDQNLAGRALLTFFWRTIENRTPSDKLLQRFILLTFFQEWRDFGFQRCAVVILLLPDIVYVLS